MSKKTFILGVGCQKGGTSWLYTYFNNHPQCEMSSTKELHILDSYFMPNYFSHAFPLPHNYTLDHYVDLFCRKVKHRDFTGEFTPSYCVLNESNFRSVRTLMEKNGFMIKIIYLLRDPVERIISQYTMERHLGIVDQNVSVEQYITSPSVEMRSFYKQTLINLKKAFHPEQVWIGFYETLFQQDTIDTLTDWLGLEQQLANINEIVNPSINKTLQFLMHNNIDIIRKQYDSQYQYCAEVFGKDFIKSIWKNY
jgi:hypothetical protein